MSRYLAAVALAAFLLAAVFGLLGQVEPSLAQVRPSEAYGLVATWESDPGASPVGYLRQPAGVAVGPDDTVYLVDTARGAIHLFRDGRYVDMWGGQGLLDQPHGLAWLGDRLLVADTGHGRIQRFTPDGQPDGAWTGLGEPWDVTGRPSDGAILVTDHAGDRIIVLDGAGRAVDELGHGGSAWGALDGPKGIAAWSDGRLAIVDAGNDRLQVWGADGAVQQVISNTNPLPFEDVAVYDDRLVVVTGLRRLSMFDVALGLLRAASTAAVPGGFWGVTVQPPGDGEVIPVVWASVNHDYLTGLRRYATPFLGRYEEWLALPGPAGELVSPRRIAVADDVAYVLDAWPRIQRLAMDGQALDQLPVDLAEELEPIGADLLVATGARLGRRAGISETWTWAPITPAVWIGGLAYDPPTDRIYVLDLRGQAIRVLDGTGVETSQWPLDPAGALGYQSYTDIARRADGRLLLVDRTTSALELREVDGRHLASWAVTGVPLRVAAGPGETAFVLTREGWVWKLGGDGTVLAAWHVATAAPGGRAAPNDLAVHRDGRVLVLDGLGRVLVFAPDPTAAPAEPPRPYGCTFRRDKWAAPRRIVLGETVQVTLTVSGECVDEGAAADVILVLDRSGSMQGRKMEAARAAVVTFVGEMNFSLSRVGLTVFNTVATTAVSLTNNAAAVVEAVAGFGEPVGGTDIGEAVQLAAQELAATGRPGVQHVLVVLTDGRPEGHDVDADAAAASARAAGLRLFTIGFGTDVDPELLRRMATAPDHYFFAPSAAELSGIYTEIARRIRGSAIARTMVITDVVPLNMDYLVGSAVPPVTSFTDNVLRWEFRDVTDELRLTYRLRPQQIGTWPTNEEARGRYRDGLDTDGELVFPVPEVIVVGPAKPLYLPLVGKGYCRPTKRHADVALVIDSSSSMTGEKLAAAKDAADLFVDTLRLPEDRAAVIGFNRAATLAVGLTGDRAALHAAIQGITIIPGTVIDGGVRLATAELTGPRVRLDQNRVMVLLTDGQNNAGPRPVLQAAEEARAHGILIYTVAFGTDADQALMRQVAGDPVRSYVALTAEDLRRIYGQIAGEIGCP